jgi:hypothetical protein
VTENLPDHVAENRRYWNAMADQWVSGGERAWEQEARWGEWQIPNTELPLLADDMHGQRAIELGCGTGYVSAWIRRRGATVYAIDNSDAQLATARRLSAQHGLDDIDECMATQRRSPSRMAHSTSRSASTARPSGVNRPPGSARRTDCCGPAATSCSSAIIRWLWCAYRSTGRCREANVWNVPTSIWGRMDWRDAIDEPGGIEFNLPISSWTRLFHRIGFDIIDYIEIQAPESATGTKSTVTADWAKRFPSEQVWRLKKR